MVLVHKKDTKNHLQYEGNGLKNKGNQAQNQQSTIHSMYTNVNTLINKMPELKAQTTDHLLLIIAVTENT